MVGVSKSEDVMAEQQSVQVERKFPIYFTSKVVKGFGRGSKEVGCPTANMFIDRGEKVSQEMSAMQKFVDAPDSEGVYFGYCQVIQDGIDRGVHKTALSIGLNPTYKDVRACTLEPWILHDYPEDFYDAELRLVICSFSRSQIAFEGADWLDQLKTAIRNDGEECKRFLEQPDFVKYATDPYFQL